MEDGEIAAAGDGNKDLRTVLVQVKTLQPVPRPTRGRFPGLLEVPGSSPNAFLQKITFQLLQCWGVSIKIFYPRILKGVTL